MTTTVAPIPAGLVISPDDLIARFCFVGDTGALGNPTVKNGVLTCHGFCGFGGGTGTVGSSDSTTATTSSTI